MKRNINSRRIKGTFPLTEEQRRKVEQVQQSVPDASDIRQAQDVARLHDAVKAKLADVMQLLKAARERDGVSLRELEERTGMSRGSLSRLESGQGNPTIATLQRIAEAIGREVLITVK